MNKFSIKGALAMALAATLHVNAQATNFFDGFDGTGGPNGSVWETATWFNGDIFGCTFGFGWRPSYGRLFHLNSSGAEMEFRRVNTSLSAPMRLMLNHWVGNNSSGGVNFVGTYNGGGGPAYYDWVKVSD